MVRTQLHEFRVKPVRNALFSLVDNSVDREYMEIVGSSLRHRSAIARRSDKCIVVVVGAHRGHFRLQHN